MGIINQHANLYGKEGNLLCKAGEYVRNISIVNVGLKMVKTNAGLSNPAYYGMSLRRK